MTKNSMDSQCRFWARDANGTTIQPGPERNQKFTADSLNPARQLGEIGSEGLQPDLRRAVFLRERRPGFFSEEVDEPGGGRGN